MIRNERPVPEPAAFAQSDRDAATAYIDSEDAAHAIRSRWRLVTTIALLGAILGAGLAFMQPKKYRATAVTAVGIASAGLNPDQVIRGVESLDRRSIPATAAALASVDVTRNEALQGTTNTSDYLLSAAVLPNSNLVRVDVEGPDAAQCAVVANRVPAILDAQIASMYHVFSVTSVSKAIAPHATVSPRVVRGAAVGLLLGFLIGSGLAYVLPWRRRMPAEAVAVSSPPV